MTRKDGMVMDYRTMAPAIAATRPIALRGTTTCPAALWWKIPPLLAEEVVVGEALPPPLRKELTAEPMTAVLI